MGFVQVDPKAIQFDAPQGPQAMNGFVQVDPSKIQFDAPGLMDRLGERGRAIAKDLTGPDNPLLSAVNVVGDAAGGAGDVIGSGINAITPGFVKRGLATGAQSVADYLDKSDPTSSNALLGLSKDIPVLQKQYPRLSHLADSVANIAGIAPLVKPAAALVESALPAAPITRSMVKQASSNAYQAVEDSGTLLTPQWTDKAASVLDANKQQPFFNGKVLTKEQAEVNNALSEFLPMKGETAKMSDVQALDSTLGDKASIAYVAGDANKARILGNAQDKIRELLDPQNLKPGDITGSPGGIEALTQHAIPLWSTQAKMADIEKIITRANAMDNPSTSIKTGFRNLMLNEGKMGQYPVEVQKLIRKAATSGKADDLLGILGSRLNAIAGAAVGGVPGAVASNASSMVFRGARTALKNSQGSAVLNALVENVRPSIDKYLNYTSPPKPAAIAAPRPPAGPPMYPNLASHPTYGPALQHIMAMPPAQARAALNALKSKGP